MPSLSPHSRSFESIGLDLRGGDGLQSGGVGEEEVHAEFLEEILRAILGTADESLRGQEKRNPDSYVHPRTERIVSATLSQNALPPAEYAGAIGISSRSIRRATR